MPSVAPANDLMTTAAHESLARLVAEHGLERFRVQTAVRPGVPHQEITDYAKEANIDLIVLGTHGHTGLVHMLMGSVAEKVVRLAPCPVLTVRHSEHEFVHP